MYFISLLVFTVRGILETRGNHLSGYKNLGCWDSPRHDDKVWSLEGLHEDLDGLYWNRIRPVPKCARVAKKYGYQAFAVRAGGECLAILVGKVSRRGTSDECSEGEGGHSAMNVYQVAGSLTEQDNFEGDIILTKFQKAMTVPLYQDAAPTGGGESMQYLWPERTVPYYVPPELAGHSSAVKFERAVRHWAERTCVKFVPKEGHRDWVELYREKDPRSRRCASSIGHIGRYQPIRLGDHCPGGSVIHEWGHALGLWHTQSRADRNEYVNILWKNILPGMSAQFKKYTHGKIDLLKVKYDYQSIMHYGSDYFGKLSDDKSHYLMTIQTKDPDFQTLIGQRKGAAKSDILMINKLYGCPDYPFMWHTEHWDECSYDCGPGTQTRNVFCIQSDGKKVSNEKCSNTKVPDKERKCYGKKCERCPNELWLEINRACYQVNHDKQTWQDARESCLKKGADLLTLRDEKEEQDLRTELTKTSIHLVYYWLGARYNYQRGIFSWPDDSDVVYSAWKSEEPRWGMDCTIMLNREDWGTDSCESERSYICKKELTDYKFPSVRVTRPKGYQWYVTDWGECSVTCGGGQKMRESICAKEDKEPADYSNCAEPPPHTWKTCNTQPCPWPYRWYTKSWGECSRSCGGGIQRREIFCAKEDLLPTTWEVCKEKRPSFQRRCNTQPCPPEEHFLDLPRWKVSMWSACSGSCGGGIQTRRVYCTRQHNKTLNDDYCAGKTKPLEVQMCRGYPCRTNKNSVRRCVDRHALCGLWAKHGRCSKSRRVKNTCRKACEEC